MTAWDHEAMILRTILRNRLEMDGPSDAILGDLYELTDALMRQFNDAKAKSDNAKCASPNPDAMCKGCGCWKNFRAYCS